MYGLPQPRTRLQYYGRLYLGQRRETKNAPLVVVRTRSFKTVAARRRSGDPEHAAGSGRNRAGSLAPRVGVQYDGSSNQVTFAGPGGTRVPAAIKSATSDRLAVYVPDDAESGAVKVSVNGKTSNSHEFWARFHPDADCVLEPNPPPSGQKCLTSRLCSRTGRSVSVP